MKRFSLRAGLLIFVLLIFAVVTVLAGCNRGDIPTTLPVSSIAPSSQPESSEPETSSEEQSSSSEESSSQPASSSKPAASTGSSGGTGTSTSGKVYSSAVTSSKKETFRTVKITASGVSLSNKTVTGDLVIDKGVGDGNVTLQNVTVGGTIYVYGGGENSVYLDSVTAKKLVSASTVSRPRIVAKGATVIGETQIRYDTLLEHNKLNATASGFTSIETVKTSQLLTVLKLYNISMNTITLNYDTNLYLVGSSSIGSVVANKPSYIEGGDKVGLLFCHSKNVSIDTAPAHIATGSNTYEPDVKDDTNNNDDDTTLTPLSAPRITRNGNEIRWSAVSGASNGYEVRVNRAGSTVYFYKTLSSSTRVFNIAELLDENLAPSGTFQVRVAARSTSSRDASAYSNTIDVNCTSDHPALSLTVPTYNGADPTKYIASWTAAGATRGYNVTVATNTSYSNKKLDTNLSAGAATSLDLRAAMGAGFVPLVPTAPYYIRITAKSAFEQLSVVGQFTVTRAPTPTNVAYNDTTKKLTWDAMSDVNQYRVTINGASQTVSGHELNLSNNTTYPAGSYSAGVVSLGNAGNVLNSNESIKTFTKTVATTPTLTAPSNVTLNRDTQNNILNLSFTAASGATGITHTATLYKDNVAIAESTNVSVTGTSHSFTITAGGSYTVTVTAHASGYADASATSSAYVVAAADLVFAGRGTSEKPYLISSAELFKRIDTFAANVYYYEQTGALTIDAAHRITNAFAGHYDGAGFATTVTITATATDYVGLFSTIGAGASVKNISISAGSSVVGRNNVGMIAGTNNGTIKDCILADTAASFVVGENYVGMIAGTNNGTIDNCDVTDTASSVTGTSYVGGICGLNNGTIQNCTYSGLLKKTGGADPTTVTEVTDGFGLICGANISTAQDTSAVVSSNTITGATYSAIGAVGTTPTPDPAPPGGDGAGVDGASAIMSSRLAGWLPV